MKDKILDEDWWRADRHEDRRPFLLARNAIQRGLRGWFEEQGFLEVDPAILQRSPGCEVHLHAFETARHGVDGSKLEQLWLHTSPEFAMKKLLAAGEERLFAFTHAFRNREAGPLHSSEFTMLEWYRVGASLEDLMVDCQALMKVALDAASNSCLRHGEFEARLADVERISVAEAFRRFAGIDLLASLNEPFTPDLLNLRAQASVRSSPDDDWSDLFTRILVEQVEPALQEMGPVFLYDYPRPEAALARAHDADQRVARRFELYACGLELANAFEELIDPDEQAARFEADMAKRQAIYGEQYPIDRGLLRALEEMQPTAGIALGFDRLVMLATGASRISQVMWTPPGG